MAASAWTPTHAEDPVRVDEVADWRISASLTTTLTSYGSEYCGYHRATPGTAAMTNDGATCMDTLDANTWAGKPFDVDAEGCQWGSDGSRRRRRAMLHQRFGFHN